MKPHWEKQANRVAEGVRVLGPGKLVGVGVDDDAKADAFIKHWEDNHPHVEVVDRNHLLGSVFIRVRLKGTVQ